MALTSKILTVGPVFVLLVAGAVDVQAAKAPLSQEALKEQATDVVSGKVISVISKTQESQIERGVGIHRDYVFTIKLKVASVSKGRRVKVDDEILIEAWKPSLRIPPLPGLQGHDPIPETA